MVRLFASDVVSFTHCPRRLWYDYHPPEGFEAAEADPFDQLVIDMGLEHEHVILESLAQEAEVIEAMSVDHTKELMDGGASIIYQGQLLDKSEQLFGKPDFLLRRIDGTYQAADAKLAYSVKGEIGVQLAFYRRLLGTPHPGLVYLGTGETDVIGEEFDGKLDGVIASAREMLSRNARPDVHYGETKCTSCPYYLACRPGFEQSEALSLLYGVESRAVTGLNANGIYTITDLSEAGAEELPDVPYLKGERKRKAILQAQAWKTGQMTKLSDIVLPEGTYVHFDIEANPHSLDLQQHVYLWGFLKPPYGDTDFEYVWADGADQDQDGWLAFLKKVEDFRETWPDLKLVHFSSYEKTQIRAYARRYGMEAHDTVVWLLDEENGPLYDIQKAVTDNLVLPLSGYGLKKICKHEHLVNFQWEDDESGSQWSVVQHAKFTRSADSKERQALKDSILSYNRDDVRATRKLEEWLRTL
jgi:uncharacterized protein